MMKVINLIISDIMNKCGFSVEFMTGATLDCVDPGYGYTLHTLSAPGPGI